MGKQNEPEVKVIEYDEETRFADPDYGLAAAKQFGEGTFDAIIGLAKIVLFAFAFAFDGLKELFKKKKEKK